MHGATKLSSDDISPRKTWDVSILRFGMFVGMVLVACMSASKAEASCGYYVASAKPHAKMMVDHPPARRANDASCPCNGPRCESNQSSQTIPLLSITSSAFDAAPIAADRLPASQSSGIAQVEDSTFLSELHRLLLDPPPK